MGADVVELRRAARLGDGRPRDAARGVRAPGRAAHGAAPDAVERLGLERHRVRYEDLVGVPDARGRTARELAGWLGIPAGELVPLVVGGLDPVMATAPPRPGRWRVREAELADVLADQRTLEMAARVGYDTDPATWA